MEDLIGRLTQAIIPEKVVSFPAKIFMCGGQLVSGTQGEFGSMRHFVCEYIKEKDPELFKKIIIADTVNLWLEPNSGYKDLLEMEGDLAGLVSAIPLFLESAGSIAELGSFVLIKNIAEKLLPFIESDQYGSNVRSFINLGPIRYFENRYKKRLSSYMWPLGKPSFPASDIPDDIAPKIYNKIKEFVEKADKTNAFNAKIAAHKILLVCDIINLLHVSRISEIRSVMNGLGLVINNKELRKYLLIAEKFQLIAKVHNGDNDGKDTVYFSLDPNQSDFIEYKYRPEAEHKSKATWKLIISAYIDKHDSRRKIIRKNWIARHMEVTS